MKRLSKDAITLLNTISNMRFSVNKKYNSKVAKGNASDASRLLETELLISAIEDALYKSVNADWIDFVHTHRKIEEIDVFELFV